MNRKRRARNYRPAQYNRKMQVNFFSIIVIICLSVCAGYLAAKYVIYPFLGYEPAELQFFREKDKETAGEVTQKAKREAGQEEQTSGIRSDVKGTEQEEGQFVQNTSAAGKNILEDQVDVKEIAGYALQFGSYSTKEAAEKTLAQLEEAGVRAEIREIDGQYKLIGRLFDTKTQAREALNRMNGSVAAFVAEIET